MTSVQCAKCGHVSWAAEGVACKRCGGMHGRRRNIRQVMLASFVFNAMSFLFMMRPAGAALWLSAFVAAAVAGRFFLESLPDTLQIALVSAFGLGPMVVNAVVLINHERSLDTEKVRSRLS